MTELYSYKDNALAKETAGRSASWTTVAPRGAERCTVSKVKDVHGASLGLAYRCAVYQINDGIKRDAIDNDD